jgi:hypothetical protein
MASAISSEVLDFIASPVAGSVSTAHVMNARAAADAEEQQDALELIEFRYQSLWARVELEAMFAAGLMGHP